MKPSPIFRYEALIAQSSRLDRFVDLIYVIALAVTLFRWMLLIYNAIICPQSAVGDEIHFLLYLQNIYDNGLVASLQNPIAINYTLLALPFGFVMDELVALRLVNLLLLSFFIYYLFKKDLPHFKYIGLLVLFYTGKVGIFNVGINDALFVISFAILLIEFVGLLRNGQLDYPDLFIISAFLSLTTRPLVVVYFPLILMVLWAVRSYGFHKLFRLKSVIIAFSIVLIHIPSIIENHIPSWDDKTSESDLTWAQRQYLAQLQANSGLRLEGTHPSWEEVRLYIEQQGENSLPKTFVESIFFDWNLTILEFFKDLFYSFKGLLLQTGALTFYFLFGLFKMKTWRDNGFLFSFLPLLYALLVFSFIIISNVEWRWYAPAVLLLISSVGHYLKSEGFGTSRVFMVSFSFSTFFLSAVGVYNLLIN